MEDKVKPGTLLRGRYEILGLLGQGGFGVTYKAVDRDTFNTPCVVKRLRPLSTDPYTLATARKLLEREAKVLNRLNNYDRVPRLLAHFEQDQEFYLVEEFIAGHDLTHELVDGKPLSEPEVVQLLWEVLEILRHVHAHQILHRDIKPANLMRRDFDGKLVLIDFGAVKEVGRLVSHAPGQTQVATVIGSVGYIAPEQLGGKPQPCSDIYSVGVLAIQALTGRPPTKIRDDPRTGQLLWRDLVPVSKELAEIVDRMICPRWQERFQSAAEVMEALRPLLPTPPEGVAPALSQLSVDQLLAMRLVTRGQEKARQGDLQGAIADYTLAIQLDPQNGRAYSQRGSARYKSGDWAGAVEDFTQAIQLTGDARAYVNRGIARYRLGDYEGAVADYTHALHLNPSWAVAYYNRGNAYRQLEQNQKAIEDYSRALELNPEEVRAYFNRGVVRGHLGDAQGAVADFSEVIQRDPQDVEAYFNRGVARAQLLDFQGAIEDYTQALHRDPAHSKAYYHRGLARQALGDPQGAIEDFSQAIALQPAGASEAGVAAQAELYLQRAIAYLGNNALEAALADCEQALRLNPELAPAYFYRGLARQELRDPAGALADFNRALELDPQLTKVYLNRGIAHLDLGQLEAALADLNQAIALDPSDARAYSSRGQVHRLLGDPLAALQDYTAALERDPNNLQLYFHRGQAHFDREDWPAACADFSQVLQAATQAGPELLASAHLRRGMARQRLEDWQGALADFTALIQEQPQASQGFALRAAVHLVLGDEEAALADLDRAIGCNRDWGLADAALAYRQRGDLHRQANRLQQAIADYTQVLALNPQERHALLWRALLWDQAGEIERALADYTQLLQLEPDPQTRLWALNNRGWAYAQQGDFAAAIRDYTQVLERDPSHIKAHCNRALARAAVGDWQGACQDFQTALQLQGYEGRLWEEETHSLGSS
jgi:serine/threonine-protein kinase